MSEKLEIMKDYKVAIIALSKEELERFHYKKGDTDSLANTALSIRGMKAAIVFTERDGIMKISFRWPYFLEVFCLPPASLTRWTPIPESNFI